MSEATRERPRECLVCKDPHVLPHCPRRPECEWVKCPSCGSTTGLIKGVLKAISGKVP